MFYYVLSVSYWLLYLLRETTNITTGPELCPDKPHVWNSMVFGQYYGNSDLLLDNINTLSFLL